jgi:hypothetical protein
MSRRCTLTLCFLLTCLVAATGCGSLPSGTGRADTPTAGPRETLPQLRVSYQGLAAQLDVSLCRFATVVGSSSASTQALRRAATDMANSSSWVTNHLAALHWPGRLHAESQNLIRSIAAVERELRVAGTRTTKTAVAKHVQKARQLISRIPPAGSQLRKDLQVADKTECDYGTGATK